MLAALMAARSAQDARRFSPNPNTSRRQPGHSIRASLARVFACMLSREHEGICLVHACILACM